MNHLVFLDTRAGELEKILSGVKSMVLKDFDPTQPCAPSVAPGDSLYFLRNNNERDLRVKATVVRVAPLVTSPDHDLANTLKELQPRLQLTENQYACWSARRAVQLVEFDSAQKIEAVPVAPSRIPDASNWIAFGEMRDITG